MKAMIKRKVLYVQVQLTSPLSVSSGEDEWTDSDVLRDEEGEPFVMGSSLAGAMRAYLGKKKNEDGLMGYSGKDKNQEDNIGKMSSLFISDLTFDGDTVAGVRDGVALDKNKTAMSQGKFDIEIIEARAKAHFYMELTIREGDNEAEMDQELAKIFRGINASEIHIGSKKTRGFGEFKVLSVKDKDYGKENYLDYAHAYETSTWETEENRLDNWLERTDWNAQMLHIEVPLRMKGGISIRQYAARKGEPDYIHLTDHDIPVIPGSSLAGALRHRIQEILEELQYNQIKLPKSISDIIDTAFGYVNGTEACASNIIIGESEIKNARPLTMVRTGVSRFESAVKSGALYKEKTYVDGEVSLKIAVRTSQNPEDSSWIMGLLLLALKDLQNGFLAVGGQTAIGRGVFMANGPVLIDGEVSKEEKYIAEMLQNMSGIGGSKS